MLPQGIADLLPPNKAQNRTLKSITSRVAVVESLVIDALPVGEISYIKVSLGMGHLGAPIAVPVVVAKGAQAGPIVGITSAVHGTYWGTSDCR